LKEEKWVTIDEAAKEVRRSKSTIHSWDLEKKYDYDGRRLVDLNACIATLKEKEAQNPLYTFNDVPRVYKKDYISYAQAAVKYKKTVSAIKNAIFRSKIERFKKSSPTGFETFVKKDDLHKYYESLSPAVNIAETIQSVSFEEEDFKFSISNGNVHKTVYTSDWHCPFQNQHAIEAFISFLKDYLPDVLILGGDILDCFSISLFHKKPARSLITLQHEIDIASAIIRRCQKYAKKVFFLLGNHEYRINRLIVDNKGLYGLRNLELKNLFAEAGTKNVTFLDAPLEIGEKTGKSFFMHGTRYNKYVSETMIKDNYPTTLCVMGHTHKPQMRAWTNSEGSTGVCYVGGHMSNEILSGDYVKGEHPHWTKGFVVVEHIENMQVYTPHQVLMVNDVFTWNGKIYKVANGGR